MEQKLFGSRSDVGLGRVCPQLTKRNINGGSFKASGTRTDRGSPLVSRPSAKSLVSRTERRASTGLIGIARDQVVQPSPEGVRTRRRWRIISVQPSCDILDLKVLWNEARPCTIVNMRPSTWKEETFVKVRASHKWDFSTGAARQSPRR